MREVTSCADNLVLFGEMLQVAAEYIDRCEETLGTEPAFMVGLAHGQIYALRQRLVKLEHRLRNLESQLRPEGHVSEKNKKMSSGK
jgi:hypothetical protein